MRAIPEVVLAKARKKADIGDDLRGVTVEFGKNVYSWERFEELYQEDSAFPAGEHTVTLHLCTQVSCADDTGGVYPTRDLTIDVG